MKLRIVKAKSPESKETLFLVDQDTGDVVAKVYGHDGQDVEGNAKMIVQGVAALGWHCDWPVKPGPVAVESLSQTCQHSNLDCGVCPECGHHEYPCPACEGRWCYRFVAIQGHWICEGCGHESDPTQDASQPPDDHEEQETDRRSTSVEPPKEIVSASLPFEPLPAMTRVELLCPECRGFGFNAKHPKKCPVCRGTGHKLIFQPSTDNLDRLDQELKGEINDST